MTATDEGPRSPDRKEDDLTGSGAGGRGRVATRFGPQPAETHRRSQRAAEPQRRAGSRHGTPTRITIRVPRTPRMADGVSSRTASGDSFAILPDTYATRPRAIFSTIPRLPWPGE